MPRICKTSAARLPWSAAREATGGPAGPRERKPFGARWAIGYRGSLHGIDGDSCR
jgi:hypothetical protein